MKKTETLDEAIAPDGTVLTLYRHDRDYYIRANGIELMSTRRHHSEEKLAELGCAHLAGVADAAVLVGGLGFGFTLRAALRTLRPDAHVVVVELLEQVIAWNEHKPYALAHAVLHDPRVTVRRADVGAVIGERAAAYDAIMLDVDNGAESFTTGSNAALYSAAGIAKTVAALKPWGVLAYWSDRPDDRFAGSLRGAGLTVESVRVRAHSTTGPHHHVIIARQNGQ